MIGIIANALAVVVGTAIGVVVKHFLTDRYKEALWMVLGFAALGVGTQTIVSNNPLYYQYGHWFSNWYLFTT